MTKKILPVYAAFILLLACSITSQAGTPTTSTKLSPSPTEIPTPLEPTATPWETSILPSLRNYADIKGIRFGTYFPWQVSSDPNWQTVAGEEFNQANLFDGFSWRDLEPQQGVFNFSFSDTQVALARSLEMEVCGHTLLWPIYEQAYPDWVLNGNFSANQLEQYLREYITTVINHYKDDVHCWIVIEEPYNPPEREWDLLYNVFGYDYIDLAYQIAREADPSALLIYNDEFNLTSDGENTELTRQTVQRLARKGLVDGVGLEMHLDATQPPDKQDVLATMQSYGMPVHVTEIDVNLAGVPGTQEERYGLQAQIYGDMLSACLESGICASFSVWGLGDKYSWLERYSTEADPTLFDDNLGPKPAYYTLLEIMKP